MAERQQQVNHIAIGCFGIALCIFMLLSLFSFNVNDWPNPDVALAQAKHNLCGRVGAFCAYYSFYYLGPAAIWVVIAAAAWFLFYCMSKPVEQLLLRWAGVLLAGSAISASYYLISPGGVNSLSQGNGGVLGIALGHFLLKNTAVTGSSLIIAATLLVGMVLAADNVILFLPKLLAGGVDRLGKAGPVLAGVGARAGSFGARSRRGLSDTRKMLAIATPQQEAAIREVASLDEEEEEQEELFADVPGEIPPDETGPAEDKKQQEIESRGSLEAVSSVLTKMRGALTRSAAAPAGADRDYFNDYRFPPLELLETPVKGFSAVQDKIVRNKGQVLEKTLAEFNIDASVVEAETGPVITMFELQLAPGIKVAQISNLANDLARSLGAAAVRVVAPLPGRHTIGIEVPNSEKEKVRIKELIELGGDKPGKMQIPLFLGKDASGEALIVDLTSLPHLLIAGTTGSGKSVCINSIITSIVLTQRPDIVKMILVDPKMVEMNSFRDLPHLMCPIVTEMKRSEQILEWLTVKMDERYALLAEGRVRNIAGFNRLTEEQIYDRFCPSTEEEKVKIPLRLPYIVIVIDELADLMMTSAKEVEGFIIRLAQKSRAVGIHIVLATQRPQATVVTGLIKSNLPSRISFRVAARMDSRIVLDQNGAEALLGQGDMLFLQPGTSDLIRAQGTYLSETEIRRIMKFLREVSQPHFHPELVQLNQVGSAADMEKDELFDEAVRMVLETKRGSVSLLQRRLTIGYSRASRLIDQMALAGIVGEYKGSQAREVLITPQEYETIKKQMDLEAAQGYQDLQQDKGESKSEAPGADRLKTRKSLAIDSDFIDDEPAEQDKEDELENQDEAEDSEYEEEFDQFDEDEPEDDFEKDLQLQEEDDKDL